MNYSDKNILIPLEQDCKLYLISKTEKFIERIRWKALKFLRKLDLTEKESYGFMGEFAISSTELLKKFQISKMV